MQNTNNGGGTEKINIRVQKNLLDHLEFTSIATARNRLSSSCVASVLFGAFIHASQDIELPVAQIVQHNAQRQSLDSRIEFGHV